MQKLPRAYFPLLAVAVAALLLNGAIAQAGPTSFAPPQTSPAGQAPAAVASGDYNNDGKADLAIANRDANSISIFLGNGDGTFLGAVDYPVAAAPVAVITADFDGDAKPDLAVANRDNNSVSVLLGSGDGTFQAAVTQATGGAPVALAAADFDGDGRLDLAAANSSGNSVSVLAGNGDGTFQGGVAYGTGTAPVALVAADFDDDGAIDLATADRDSNAISLLPGNGDGTFRAALPHAAGTTPVAIAAADFDGNGWQDLAVANRDADGVSLLLGNGDGTFQGAVSYGVGTTPAALAAADFNNDLRLDLAAVNAGSDNVSILQGNGDATFQPRLDFGAGQAPLALAGADLDDDTREDLVIANGSLNQFTVLPNDTLLLPEISLTPAAHDFGSSVVGMSVFPVRRLFTIGNEGNAPLQVSAISLTDLGSFTLNFTAGPLPCGSAAPSLAASSRCTFEVTFHPTSTGAKSGNLQIASNAPLSPTVTAPLTGSGVPATEYANLAVAFGGGGSGSVALSTGGACTTSCNQALPADTLVTLTPAADAGSTFIGWNGCDTVAGNLCTVTLYGNRTVTPEFSHPPVRLNRPSPLYYATIAAAYAAAVNGDVLQLKGLTFGEGLLCDRPVALTISGGYDPAFGTQSALTLLSGSLVIAGGSVTATGLAIQ